MKGAIYPSIIALIACITLAPSNATPNVVTPQKAGEIAPFTGLLVPETRFTQLLESELLAEQLKKQREIDLRYAESMEDMYKAHLERATQPLEWYETPSANRWFGFTIGIVVGLVAIVIGANVVKANRDAN